MLHGVWPEAHRGATGDQIRSDKGEDGPDGAFCHTVKLVHVRRASSSSDAVGVEELSKFFG